MIDFLVYRVERADGNYDYLAFPEHFLTSPYVTGSINVELLLPGPSRKWYQRIKARDKVEAVEKVMSGPVGKWKLSCYNWTGQPE